MSGAPRLVRLDATSTRIARFTHVTDNPRLVSSAPPLLDCEWLADCRFESAWSPPLHWLDAVAEAYPQLFLELGFHVPHRPCSGRARYSRGTCTESAEFTDDVHLDALVAFVYAR